MCTISKPSVNSNSSKATFTHARRRADFDIPAPLPRVCSHIRGADAGGSAISWGQWWFGARGFEADAENWVLDPFLAERILLPLRDRACVNACNDLCWSQFSARVHPRMCERTFTVRKRSIRVKIGEFLSHVTLKFDGWPWTIGHLFYVASSFVHHLIAISYSN